VISSIVIILLLWAVIVTMGHVEGEEFSPTHFRSRTFSFYEIPIIHWQITPISRSTTTPSTAILLTQKKWITPPATPPSIWHISSLRHGVGESKDDDAALLLRQLRNGAGGSGSWSQWSQDHPELANVLWPTIAKLAERELYVLMPRLLEIVRPITSVEPLRVTIAGYLRQEYRSLIRDMRAAGRDDLADALLAEAAEDEHLSFAKEKDLVKEKQPVLKEESTSRPDKDAAFP
jgi:hypothetical protein